MPDSVQSDSDPRPPAPADGQPPVGDFLQQRTVKRELLNELRNSWLQGNPVPVDDLLQRWPTDPDSDGDVASLHFEDYLHRTRVVPSSQSADVQAASSQHPSVLALIHHHE